MSQSSRALPIALCVTAALALAASAAHARRDQKTLMVPDALSAPDGNKLKLTLFGVGIQRYQCTALDGGYRWKFIEPEAQLLDRNDRPTGHHGAGPTWRALDGSEVTAAKRAEATLDPESIPWLLLEATGHQAKGLLDDITYIQRVKTEGGLPPDAPCTEANSGETNDVPYRALYRFYSPRGC